VKTPYELIGGKYRLGATWDKHGATDCIGLAIQVLNWYGYETPKRERDWYRRLRRGDTAVFKEELHKWGDVIDTPTIGSVALCVAPNNSYAMAVYFEGGWLSYVESAVKWSPIGLLEVVEVYCSRQKSSCVKH
jgi:hypothetical protein